MKKVSIMLSLMLGLSAVSLSSCSDSDDDNIITPGSVENIDPAKVFPLGLPAKVNGMPVTTDAEGRVTAIGNMVTFDYNSYIPGRADRSYDVLMKVADGSEIYYVAILLNHQGYVRYATSTYQGELINEWSLQYNNAGRVSDIRHHDYDEDNITVDYRIEYQNGNPTKLSAKGDGHSATATTDYTNGTHPSGIDNKGGYIFWYDGTGGFDFEELIYAYYAGMLGIAPKNLPLKLHQNQDNGAYEGIEEYTWALDSNGYPASMTMHYIDYTYGDVEEEGDNHYIFNW